MSGIPVAGAGPRRTALAWAIYTGLLGVVLNLRPNLILQTFGLPPTTDPWIRVMGMFLLFISYQNVVAYRSGNTELLQVSVHVRLMVPFFFGLYVAFGLVPPVILLFAIVDVAAALWTSAALRDDSRG